MIIIKLADSEDEFQQIHQLNYETFVNEIPQHAANPQALLVDKFHGINKYVIAKENMTVVGMLAYNDQRPFSIDHKLENIAQYLPHFQKPVEIRLLSISKAKRKSPLFFSILEKLVQQLNDGDFDIVLISGTTRQLKLYHKIGFVDFAHLIGTAEAQYQPMYLTKNNIQPDYINQWLHK